MTDALSAIAKDERIGSKYEECLSLEDKFFSKTLSKKNKDEFAKKIINAWGEFAGMGSGYSTSSSPGIAKNRIRLFGEYLEGNLGYNNLREEVRKIKRPHGYFAVGSGCHGRLMKLSDMDLIKDLLREKVGEVPHSFFVSRDEQGKISIEKATCKNCPLVGNCSMTENCNGYKKEEYDEAIRKRRDNLERANKYCEKFGLGNLVVRVK